MKLSNLSLAIWSVLSLGLSAEVMALDLYVDKKTQQIYAEPGPGRTKLGTFQQVEEKSPATAASEKAELAAQKAEIAKIKDDLALKNNELKAIDEHLNDPSHGVLHMDEKGVRWESKDGNFDMQLTGRLQVDSNVSIDQHAAGANTTAAPGGAGATPNTIADGANIRRARLGVEGAMYKDFGYKFEYDFTRGNGLSGGVTDAFLSYKGIDPLTLTIGQYKEFFSLEEATSNRYLSFLERNMATNAFSDNNNPYKVGLGAAYAQPRYTAQMGFQTESVGNGAPTSDSSSFNTNFNANRNGGSGDMSFGFTGRLTGLPWYVDKTKFLHVGASGSDRWLNTHDYICASSNPTVCSSSNNSTTGALRFASDLDTSVDRQLILDTGNLSGVSASRVARSFSRFGGETALVYGPFSAQAEYIQTNVSGTGYSGNNLNGAYGYVSYFVTGESRTYKAKTGAWDRIKPNQNFNLSGHGVGAWELLLGYDHLDLNSGIIQGGRASAGKVGVNWYPNPRFRVMANFVHYLDINTANVGTAVLTADYKANSRAQSFNGTHPDFFELRGQVDF